ncbi:hypothetical protein HCX48_03850 [Rhodocyclus tenuis]|uniref:Sulfur reduction protein DsrE n=1 Tax=Rhodocyclus gracilis TaxID=2929842 RepID=A0ABX0WG58_9RHOO|nr:hypothetical protein [Rhodocyclus gracilis]NJA88355.1 hypothetical protein [Rhodocyclus gracilis]
MQSVLIIVNAPACAGEGIANALQLATAILHQQRETVNLRLYFMSGSLAGCCDAQGNMLASAQVSLQDLVRQGAQLLFCSTHAQATLSAARVHGAGVGSLASLAEWTLAADKVVCF